VPVIQGQQETKLPVADLMPPYTGAGVRSHPGGFSSGHKGASIVFGQKLHLIAICRCGRRL